MGGDCKKCGAKRIDSQLGLEKTPAEYVEKMVEGFREVRRVLRGDGTLWLNLGDSYAGYWGGKYAHKPFGKDRTPDSSTPPHKQSPDFKTAGFKPKDLIGIPWRVAFALQADGWWLRQDIIWHKPNPMPESVTDRCTKAHEYIFLLTKNERYFYDHEAIKEPAIYGDARKPYAPGQVDARGNGHDRQGGEIRSTVRDSWKGSEFHTGKTGDHQLGRASKKRGEFNGKTNALEGREAFRAIEDWRNKRSVWTMATHPYKEAHFATFPPELIRPCILAGSRKGDTILDPFGGSGTTGMVAIQEGRLVTLIELNPEYAKLIRKRCKVSPFTHRGTEMTLL